MTQPPTTGCQSTCPYCGVGCGVVMPDGGEATLGDQSHPANFGRLCVKGSSLHETLGTQGRLMHPEIAGEQVSWPSAIDAVAARIAESAREYGPESVAFYLSGQLLTEDYYLANKLAKGFIGTPHVDTNSRLCMSSAAAAHKRAFGADIVPGCYEDLELADLLVITGSNAAWNHPILYQRMKAAGRKGRRVVVIDPRRTATTELADLFLPLKPGTDAVLFNGLLMAISQSKALDLAYLEAHCSGYDGALAAAQESAPTVADVARICELPEADVARFYDWFIETPRSLTFFSQGINQSASGTDKGNAIINCHLATGRVGKPGASPFSITGQPNAMGGREVGGLANTLAAHMEYDKPGDRERVIQFWEAPSLPSGPGLKAVDLFEAVHNGKIKVLWVMATNPAVSLPDNARVREALDRCETVIVSDCVRDTDTTAYADILLPARGWGEKDGTVTNSERRISRQRAFQKSSTEAMPDWWILNEVGRALGYKQAFAFTSAADVFREHAALSAYENDGRRPFNLAGLRHISDESYDQLKPVQWPVLADPVLGTARLFGDGRYATPDRRARFIAIRPQAPAQQPGPEYPLVVNTGRIRDQWHTMTRTGRAPRLWNHLPEPFIEINPRDAMRAGVTDGQLAQLEGPSGRFTGRARVTDAVRQGDVFVPIHWNRQFSGEALASDLIAPVTDPFSGQPESKHGCARLKALHSAWEGRLLLAEDKPPHREMAYWAKAVFPACASYWLAGEKPLNWPDYFAGLLGEKPQLVMHDPARGGYRAATFAGGRLKAVLIIEPSSQTLPDPAWLASCFAMETLDGATRRKLLAGRDAELPDTGAIVCSCFQVGEITIRQAVEAGAKDTESLGLALKCGTNCGSCIPELKQLISAVQVQPVEADG